MSGTDQRTRSPDALRPGSLSLRRNIKPKLSDNFQSVLFEERFPSYNMSETTLRKWLDDKFPDVRGKFDLEVSPFQRLPGIEAQH